jgi:hypothetical protein
MRIGRASHTSIRIENKGNIDMKQTQYDVFISYSRKDYVDEQKNIIPGNEVSKIKDALSEAGITYWFDEEGIYSGQNFVEKILTNIENAKIFLFLSTANSNKSPWTCKEIASADEFKKHIIPVRIDSSPYNKKVLFRIADLDYIEYYNNPQKGIEHITKAIKAYLEDLVKAEKLKEEEENKKKELERKREEDKKRQNEQDEKRRQEEQLQLESEIRLSCSKLNNEEAKLELSRENLLLNTKKILDDGQRTVLVDLIQKGGIIHKKYQEKCSELIKEINNLKSTGIESLKLQLKSKDDKISQLTSDLESLEECKKEQEKASDRLIGQIGDLQKQLKTMQKEKEDGTLKIKPKFSKRTHILYWLIIVSLLITATLEVIKLNNESQSWEYRYNVTWDKLRESDKAQETLKSLGNHIPFIITDIEVKNHGEEWGDKIYSSKSTYFTPRIKYIGINSGNYKLYFKIFDNNGMLSKNEEKSPKGYSFSHELSLVRGENISDELSGWGNEEPGNWPTGTYRIEVWYKEKKLSEKTYRVY